MNEQKVSFSEIILTVYNSETHLYDLNVVDDYVIVWDSKSDTVMRAISINENMKQNIFVSKGFRTDELWEPNVVKNIKKREKRNTFFVMDNNMYLKELSMDDGFVTVYNMKTFHNLCYSSNFNITEKDLFAVSCKNEIPTPFYFYNKEDGYYWVDPDVSIVQKNPFSGVGYLSNLCVNEDKAIVTSAYRFVNCVSFYNLEGMIMKNYIIGDAGLLSPNINKSNGKMNIELSSKFFIHIYGTSEYVYCLYSHSENFSSLSKVLVFNWNCEYVKTYSMDRSLSAIAIDNEDKYIFALSYSDDKNQVLLRYEL